MDPALVIGEACDRIEAACEEIEAAFRQAGSAYVFPRAGIECIVGEARWQAEAMTMREDPGVATTLTMPDVPLSPDA